MFRLLPAVCLSLLLAACQSTGPASVAGECRIFSDPGFAVRGEHPVDSRWISRTQEAGIAACGWPRPQE
jgi:hypothetical protein